jgi:hypothetical protein
MIVVLKNIAATKKTTTAKELEPGFFAYAKRETVSNQIDQI